MPSASAILPIASWSALCPNRSTGITAFGLRPSLIAVAMPRLSELASMLKVASSTSTNTGVAPVSATGSPVAQNVNDGQSTASPRPTPLAISTISSASVPLAHVTTCLAPLKAASSSSSCATSGPLMNWQWASTRSTASSRDLPSRRRCAAMSINGRGSGRRCWFMEPCKSWERDIGARLADDATRPLARGGGCGWPGGGFQTTGRDFEAGHAFIAGHCRHAAGAHRIKECDQFGAQRLVMANRQVAHRVAAVRLEAEAFGHLAGQKITHDVLAASGDGDAAGFERCQPVGVDVRKYAGGGAELQQRDILALGDGTGELRLHLDDIRLGEPADQIDVMHGEVDDHADVRHSRRERSHPGDRDRKDIFARYRLLDGGHRRVEAFDMPHHQGHAGAAGSGDNVPPLLDRRRDRLFDHYVNATRDAGERDLMMKVRRRSDCNRIDILRDQLVEACEGAAAGQVRHTGAMRWQGINVSDQRYIRQAGQHAGMIAAHDARADDADAKRTLRLGFHARRGPFGIHMIDPTHPRTPRVSPVALLARRPTCGECPNAIRDTF